MTTTMTLDEFIRETYFNRPYQQDKCFGNYIIRPRVICNDGFSISIQGSEFHYCSPRYTCESYSEFELGYPSKLQPELKEYAETPNRKSTIFAYVPHDVVESIIEKHGGINRDKTYRKANSYVPKKEIK